MSEDKTYGLTHSIGELTPNVCTLCGVRRPAQQSFEANADVLAAAARRLEGRTVEKVLLYASDAVGDFLLKKYPAIFAPLIAATDLMVPSLSVMPSVTPVCFGTIFTGTTPEIHGIRQYEKPVLRCETLFDVFPERGKRAAILADNNCSIDRIFRDRPVDYFSFAKLDASWEMAPYVIEHGGYDLILLYDGRYDTFMHHNGIDSTIAIDALATGIDRFRRLAELTDRVWAHFDRMMIYCPDHGAHAINAERGTHGDDCRDDLAVNHFYRFRPAAE